IRNIADAMTMSAQMGAATGEKVWEDRYHQQQKSLEDAYHNLMVVAPDIYTSKGGKDLEEASAWLATIDERAFEQGQAGNEKQARRQLSEPEYVNQRKRFSVGLDKIHAALGSYIEDSSAALYRGLWVLVGLCVGAIFIAG